MKPNTHINNWHQTLRQNEKQIKILLKRTQQDF